MDDTKLRLMARFHFRNFRECGVPFIGITLISTLTWSSCRVSSMSQMELFNHLLKIIIIIIIIWNYTDV